MTDIQGKSGRLVLLDGLRGLAALAVMFYHVGNVFEFHWAFARSYLFVDIFFVLSGFVLTLVAEPRMARGQSGVHFMRARIRRLWPTIAIGALIGAAVTGLVEGWQDVPVLLAMALLMIPTFTMSWQVFPLNGPQWSLFHEFLANVVHALLLRRITETTLLILVLASGAFLGFLILANDGNDFGPIAANFWWSLSRIAFSYTLGVWFGRVWSRTEYQPLVSWQLALTAPLVVGLALPYLPLSRGVGDAVVTLVVFPALFWLAATAPAPKAADGLLKWLGDLSYPVYAVHLPILTLFGAWSQSLPVAVLAVLASLIAALVVGRLTGNDHRQRSPVNARGAAPAPT